jgi:hypothetical protein
MRSRIRWLVAVVVIITIFGVWRLLSVDEVYSKEDKTRVQLGVIAQSLQDYAARHGVFPRAEEGLDTLVMSGEFTADGLKDPWNQMVIYECLDKACNAVKLTSLGPLGSKENGKSGQISLVIRARGK